MRFDGNAGPAVNYEPNSFGGPEADPAYAEPPLKISGDADRYEQKRGVDDDYIQPGNLFRLMPPDEQQRLMANIVGTLKDVPRRSRKRWSNTLPGRTRPTAQGWPKGWGSRPNSYQARR